METIQRMFRVSLLMLLVFLVGCASGPKVNQRYVWPQPPDEPKIEFLGAYKDQKDLVEKGLAALILGEETPDVLINPAAIAADGHGKVYVVDAKQGVVVFDFMASTTHTFAGDMLKPSGIAIDGEGNIYVGETGDRKIYVFDKNEKPLSSIDLSAQAKSIGHFAIDKERKRLAVPDPKANKVHIVDFTGKFITTIDKYEGQESVFNLPAAAAFDRQGNIIVTDTMHAHIVRFAPDGKFLSLFGQRGDGQGDFAVIRGVAVDSEGHIYVTDAKSNRFSIFDEKGKFLLSVGVPSGSQDIIGSFQIPFGIFIDPNDTIYIVEKFIKRFQKYQYLNPAYLAKHPITKDTLLATPIAGETKGKEGEKKPGSVPPPK